jgi:hypothetical protein
MVWYPLRYLRYNSQEKILPLKIGYKPNDKNDEIN